MRIKKIDAGALQFVLFIGALIAILLTSFLLLSYTQSHFNTKANALVSVVKTADYGIEASLGQKIPLNEKISIPIKNELDIAVEVKRQFWGVFEKRTVTTKYRNTKFQKVALLGGKPLIKMPSLYVSDHQRPVILAGNARITGEAFLPERGLKMGNINGFSYNRSSLLYGRQKRSKAELPALNDELEHQIKQLTNIAYSPIEAVPTTLPTKELKNSFLSGTLIIRDNVIRLSNINLAGNIIISATKKISVEADANLKDVILIAPEIHIKGGVKGQFQAIASRSIMVGRNCELNYPSALVLQNNKMLQASPPNELLKKPIIYIDEQVWFTGVVVAINNTNDVQYSPLVKVEANVNVIGEIYCNKNLELKGRVAGMVNTDSFIALEGGSIYQNHLYNGEINSQLLHESYTGLLLTSREQNIKVMQWLY